MEGKGWCNSSGSNKGTWLMIVLIRNRENQLVEAVYLDICGC